MLDVSVVRGKRHGDETLGGRVWIGLDSAKGLSFRAGAGAILLPVQMQHLSPNNTCQTRPENAAVAAVGAFARES